jgi:putative SOS response-associated peptidase YedK
MRPRFNFAPLQSQVVIRLDAEGRREPRVMRWELLPNWSKDNSAARSASTPRQRRSRPNRASAPRSNRGRASCRLPAFYEWQKLPDGEKQPYITTAAAEPFAFAGLWEWWRPIDAPGLETSTILTTEPNKLCARQS